MAETTKTDWHYFKLTEVFQQLRADREGLTSVEADKRLVEVGPNSLPQQKSLPFWRAFARQFHSPLIYILAIAGLVSIAIGEHTDAAFIFGVLLLNASIGGFQEWRAEKSSLALQRLFRTRATVVRDREPTEIDAEGLVPGDLVLLESGNRVPADLRLLSTKSLEVDESLLTGESRQQLNTMTKESS